MVLHLILNLTAKIAIFFAMIGAGSASIINNYQPKLPEQLIK